MATYTANRVASTIPAKYSPTEPVFEFSQYSGSATFSSGDVIQMLKVNAGARLVYGHVSTNEDTYTTQTTYAIGDGVDTDRYFASATIVPSSIARLPNLNTGNVYEYTAADTIDVRIENKGGTGGATVLISLGALIDYTGDDPSSH